MKADGHPRHRDLVACYDLLCCRATSRGNEAAAQTQYEEEQLAATKMKEGLIARELSLEEGIATRKQETTSPSGLANELG